MNKILLHYFYVLLTFISVQSIFSQEIPRKGAHELQMEEFGAAINTTTKTGVEEKQNIILLQKKTTTLTKKVFGFLPYWEQSAGAHANMQYDRLSHLACFNFLVKLDASITPPSGWPWTTEINAAHAAGTKVVMTITNFGTGGDDANAVAEELITNTSKQTIFFANIKSIIEAANLDGVNIDFEAMVSTTRDADLNTFMAALTSYIHTQLPGKEVSFDSPAVNWGGWDFNGLVNSVDYLIIMAYDYTGSSGPSGPLAPLIHPISWGKSVTYTLENAGTGYAGPVANSPEKLVLAVPYYGRHWKTSTQNPGSSIVSSQPTTRFKDTEDQAVAHGGWLWDTDYEFPWYKWHDGTNWNQVWSDNTQSIEAKFDLALAKNLGGVGIWALNYDGTKTEFWDLISTKFESTASVDDSFIKEHISVYPNPTTNFIKISNTNKVKLNSIILFDILGQSVLEVNPERKSINLNNLTNGIYFLKIEDETGKQGTFKVLKSN